MKIKKNFVGAHCDVPLKYNRKSIRLKDYDYSQPGAYFITICTYKHRNILGKIYGGKMHLNEFGRIVEEEWNKTGEILKSRKPEDIALQISNMLNNKNKYNKFVENCNIAANKLCWENEKNKLELIINKRL